MPIGTQRVKDWFFEITNVLRRDGTTGGVRFRTGDKPTEQTYRDLVTSVAFMTDVVNSSATTSQQGLVTIATDAQAKAGTNTTQPQNVPTPSQLPVVVNATNDSITSPFADFSGPGLNITVDGTITTRNSFVSKLSTNFSTWLGNTFTTINNALNALSINGYKTNSGTSLTPGLGSFTFTLGAGAAFSPGVRIRLTSGSVPTTFIEGVVTAYNSGTLSTTILADSFNGSTESDWLINLGTPSYIPTGGNTGQSLIKVSGTDYDTQWTTLVPTGGASGQALVKNSSTNYDVSWTPVAGAYSSGTWQDFTLNSGYTTPPDSSSNSKFRYRIDTNGWVEIKGEIVSTSVATNEINSVAIPSNYRPLNPKAFRGANYGTTPNDEARVVIVNATGIIQIVKTNGSNISDGGTWIEVRYNTNA